jgi:hypothetical protein
LASRSTGALPEQKSCQIVCSNAFDSGNKEIWPAIIDWMMDSMNRLKKRSILYRPTEYARYLNAPEETEEPREEE